MIDPLTRLWNREGLTRLLAEHGVVARSIEAGWRSLAERFDELLADGEEETR